MFDRPREIDNDLIEIRKASDEAREVLEKTKATLNGEEQWFIDQEDNKND